jgi:AcrR family transcriptional regulator
MPELGQAEQRVDPRVKRTRQWLQQALMDLMIEKSFEAITVQDIAERAGVNRVTFYAHFNDKFALLEHAVRAAFRQRLRAVLLEGSPFSAENLAALIQAVAENLAEVRHHCPPPRGQMDTLLEKQVKAEIYEVILGWLQPPARSAGSRPMPEQAAMMASWAIYGAAVQWSQAEPREPSGEFARQLLPLILAGLQPVLPGSAAGRAQQKSSAFSRT